jgi:PKD repeat protein
MIITLGAVLAITPKPAPAAEGPIFDHEYVVVRAFFADREMVNALAEWREPWEVNYTKNYLVVEVTADEYMQLLDIGFTIEIDEVRTAEFNQPNIYLPDQVDGIPGYPCYRTVEETFATAQDIAAQYPDFATWTDIGDSWEKANGFGGYDMMVLRLTNGAISGPKPKLFIMSAIHAREYTTAELNTRFAEYLINNYGTNADATWLLDYNEVHFLLQSNPDGRKKAESGLSWRKNTNQNYCSPTSNSRGADLNRNFQFQWDCCGGSSGSQCDSTYRGPSPASEPEVQAVQNYVFSQYPDLRDPPINASAPLTTTGIFMDIHSSGELVLWPWGFTNQIAGNGTQLQTLGRKFAYFNNYYPEQAIGLYITDGTTDDFAYGELGIPAYTFELGTSFFQSCGVFESTILPDNLEALIYAAKSSRAPYLEPAGPDALNLALALNPVETGTAVTLTATLNDTRFNNQNGTEPTQNIAAAEYYIDVPPWVTTTTPIAVAMTAVDGNFNSPIEAAQGVVDTSSLGNGKHTLFVRGQDASGNWGVFSAIFLYVIDPAVAPIIGGDVRAADTNLPLAATVTANDIFQATTDINGVYQMQVISDTYALAVVPDDPTYALASVSGIVAHNLQTVQQDFLLYPICDIFSDDVESGTNGWTTDAPWAITTESAHSPTHSWTDSPGVNYGNNLAISLTSPVFDLSDYSGLTLNYWQICDTEAGYDYCTVEASTDGITWNAIASYDGNHTQWEEINLDLSILDNQPTAQIRFHLTSDVFVTDNGWHVDDITLRGGGPVCVENLVPTADFELFSPIILGNSAIFTNTSTGDGLQFFWEFGDGATSTVTNPSHLYMASGVYTVTLTVSNSVGSDVATGTIAVWQAPAASFSSSSPDLLGATTVFTNTSTGDNLQFSWGFGDGVTSTLAAPTHVYTATGVYTVTLAVSNEVGSVSVTAVVEITAVSSPQFTIYLPAVMHEP